MGRKRTRKRQYLFFYCAVLIITMLIAAGCKPVLDRYNSTFGDTRRDMDRAAWLMNEGGYDEALRISETVYHENPGRMGDHALFQMGLIFADPENPKQDVRHAKELFERLTMTYPKSDLVAQARLWTRVLTFQGAGQDQIEQLAQTIRRFAQTVEGQKQEIDRLTDQLAQGSLELEELKARLAEMEGKNQRLEEQIMQMKDIELEIQHKKEKMQ